MNRTERDSGRKGEITAFPSPGLRGPNLCGEKGAKRGRNGVQKLPKKHDEPVALPSLKKQNRKQNLWRQRTATREALPISLKNSGQTRIHGRSFLQEKPKRKANTV